MGNDGGDVSVSVIYSGGATVAAHRYSLPD